MPVLNRILLFTVLLFNRVVIPKLKWLGIYCLALFQDLPRLIDAVSKNECCVCKVCLMPCFSYHSINNKYRK